MSATLRALILACFCGCLAKRVSESRLTTKSIDDDDDARKLIETHAHKTAKEPSNLPVDASAAQANESKPLPSIVCRMSSVEDKQATKKKTTTATTDPNKENLGQFESASKVRKMDKSSDVSVDKKVQQKRQGPVDADDLPEHLESSQQPLGVDEQRQRGLLSELASNLVENAIDEAQSEISVHERYQMQAQSLLEDTSVSSRTNNKKDYEGGEL